MTRVFQGRRAEEARAQSLSAELSSVRHEMEKRLAAKEEELESVRSVGGDVSSFRWMSAVSNGDDELG